MAGTLVSPSTTSLATCRYRSNGRLAAWSGHRCRSTANGALEIELRDHQDRVRYALGARTHLGLVGSIGGVALHVELRLRGTGYRLVNVVFSDCDVSSDGQTTLISLDADDEAAALGLIERARSVGFTVLSWQCVRETPEH